MSNRTRVPRALGSRAWLGTTLVSALALTPAMARAQIPGSDRAAVERRLTDAEGRRDWAAALEAATTLNERAEEAHLEALYRVARLQALLGRTDRAYESLDRLRQAGLFDVQRLRRDEAFAALRDEPRFKAIAQAIWLKGYLWILERPERDAYQQPDRVMPNRAESTDFTGSFPSTSRL